MGCVLFQEGAEKTTMHRRGIFRGGAAFFSVFAEKGQTKGGDISPHGCGRRVVMRNGRPEGGAVFRSIVQKYTKMAEMACRRLSFAGKSVIII